MYVGLYFYIQSYSMCSSENTMGFQFLSYHNSDVMSLVYISEIYKDFIVH